MDSGTKILIEQSIEIFNEDFKSERWSSHVELAALQSKVLIVYHLAKKIYHNSTPDQEIEILPLVESIMSLLMDIEDARMSKSVVKIHINTTNLFLN